MSITWNKGELCRQIETHFELKSKFIVQRFVERKDQPSQWSRKTPSSPLNNHSKTITTCRETSKKKTETGENKLPQLDIKREP